MEAVTLDKTGAMKNGDQPYHTIVVALYENIERAQTVAERLVREGIPAPNISVLVSEGKLKESLDAGNRIIPAAEFRGVQRQGAIGGAFLGGAAGLLLGAEVVLLTAVFALPLLAGAALLGVAVGTTWGAISADMDMGAEGTGYRIHLQQGGALLVVYAADYQEANRAEAILRQTQPSEIGRHPLAAPTPLTDDLNQR